MHLQRSQHLILGEELGMNGLELIIGQVPNENNPFSKKERKRDRERDRQRKGESTSHSTTERQI